MNARFAIFSNNSQFGLVIVNTFCVCLEYFSGKLDCVQCNEGKIVSSDYITEWLLIELSHCCVGEILLLLCVY